MSAGSYEEMCLSHIFSLMTLYRSVSYALSAASLGIAPFAPSEPERSERRHDALCSLLGRVPRTGFACAEQRPSGYNRRCIVLMVFLTGDPDDGALIETYIPTPSNSSPLEAFDLKVAGGHLLESYIKLYCILSILCMHV